MPRIATRSRQRLLRSIGSVPSLGGFVTAAAGDALVGNLIAIAGFTLLLAGAPVQLGALLVVGSVVGTLLLKAGTIKRLTRQIAPTGTFVISRIILALAVGLLTPTGGADDPLTWIAGGILASLAALELSVARVARAAIPFAANLPGIATRNGPLVSAGWVFAANAGALLVCTALSLTGASGLAILAISVLPLPLTALVLLDAVRRILERLGAERRLGSALEALAPKFVFHWDAPADALYQAAMWLPYLDRIGEAYIVVVRNPAHFASVAAMTSAPVLLRRDLEDMDGVVVASLRVAFYANTAAKNAHFVRYRGLTHIQINHGDSDKAPSYSKAFRVFDYNFVAGQAAIDRFAAHRIAVLPGSMVIVGRPQVEGIHVDRTPIARKHSKTVLYAPTWAGFHADVNYSSLALGVEIVRSLISRGVRVIFRPHPQTDQNPGLAREAQRIAQLLEADSGSAGGHLWGDRAGREMTLVDCFNAADALITDVSSVAPDFLYSEKPFAMTAMSSTVAAFQAEFPLAKASYVIHHASPFEEQLDLLLGTDPLLPRRRQLKEYYLGDFPNERYADGFLSAARAHVNG